MNGADERQIVLWARVIVMICESYTQLLFEAECEFLLDFLACCFRLSPSTAQPLFEFWAQVKEMHREDLLTNQHVQMLLLRLTEACVTSLLTSLSLHRVSRGGFHSSNQPGFFPSDTLLRLPSPKPHKHVPCFTSTRVSSLCGCSYMTSWSMGCGQILYRLCALRSGCGQTRAYGTPELIRGAAASN